MDRLEIIFKIIELILTAIGLIFIVFGWIIPYKQALKTKEKEREFQNSFQQKTWEKELIDQQISLFYGPISTLLQEDTIRFGFVLYEMGKKHVFDKDQLKFSDLPIDDQKRWKHYVDTYKIPTQNKIIEIIEKNRHLIYKSEIPTCFNIFMKYALGWEFLDNQFRNNVPNYYEYYYSHNFPYEFIVYINNTLELLLKIQMELTNSAKYESTAF